MLFSPQLLHLTGSTLAGYMQKIAELYESLHQYDSSLYYARLAHAFGKSVAQKFDVLGASELLVRLHKQSNNSDSAFLLPECGCCDEGQFVWPPKKF